MCDCHTYLDEHCTKMSRIVVTGADGFIGKPLTRMLTSAGHEVIAVTRKQIVLGDRQITDLPLESSMRESQAVIHLAGRAHVTRELNQDPLAEFRRANFNGTLSVAEMAARAGVPRFVFVSSIGVLGNSSGDRPFSERDAPSPQEPYAISKWESEQALISLGQKCALKIVVVRPPLVYGPHVKGNFLRLLRLIASGVPLPFGAIRNCRSYIGVRNLCDFLLSCTFDQAAAGMTFNIADGEDVSTPELVKTMAAAMGRKPRVFPCPTSILRATAIALGKRAELERLSTNLRVDSSLARAALNWHATETLRDGIAEMVRWFTLERGSQIRELPSHP
jgi:nucleoside-diphosphate-sugar epimerase